MEHTHSTSLRLFFALLLLLLFSECLFLLYTMCVYLHLLFGCLCQDTRALQRRKIWD